MAGEERARENKMTLIAILHTGPWPIIRVAFTSKGAIKANTVSSTTVNWAVDLITRIWSVGGCNFRGWAQPWLELSGQSDRGRRRWPPRERFTVHSQMLPDITILSISFFQRLFCYPVQTCHNDCSTRRRGSNGRMEGRGQQEEVVFFICLPSPYKDKL